MERIYACIDLKSFYASVECVLRGKDPFKTNLVVADITRTDKTICLAVSPGLKSFGIPSRERLYQLKRRLREINDSRRVSFGKKLIGKSFNVDELEDKRLAVDVIIAIPRMRKYMEYSRKIYEVYLNFLSKEDIYVYSVDEVFLDLTPYLKMYKLSAYELVTEMLKKVKEETGITGAAGIGTNLYLAKIAMDILAKKEKVDDNGFGIAFLDEKTYRKKLWEYNDLSDFWSIGKKTKEKLNKLKIYTMGDLARSSLERSNLLYKTFGVNAELLIDRAWGYEKIKLSDIKKYSPASKSIGESEVLKKGSKYQDVLISVKEMSERLALNLSRIKKCTNQIVMNIFYDVKSSSKTNDLEMDSYGRAVPRHSHGTINLNNLTSSSSIIRSESTKLFMRIVNKNYLIRKISISLNNIKCREEAYIQMDLFSKKDIKVIASEDKLQETILNISDKYGKNALLKGTSFLDKATGRDRNKEIGGHKA